MLERPGEMSIRWRVIWGCLTRLIATAGFAAGFAPHAGAELISLRYGQAYSSAHSVYSLPIVVAEREGLFIRAGLDVKTIIPIPGGSDKMIAALHDDWVDVTHVAMPFLIRAALAGSDAVAIDTEFRNSVYSLLANRAIASFVDLKGKLVGLADESGTISISMRKLLAAHGLKRGSFAVKNEEGTPARLNCLRRGECDAVVLGQPQDFEAMAEGYRLLGRSDEVVPNYVYTVTAARKSWAQTHQEAIIRFLRALAASFKFIRDPANRGSVVKTIAEVANTSDAVAAETLDLLVDPRHAMLPDRGEIDLEGVQHVIAMMAEAGTLKAPLPDASRFVDQDYFKAAGLD